MDIAKAQVFWGENAMSSSHDYPVCNRRQALRHGTVLVASGALTALLAACTGGPVSPPPSTASTSNGTAKTTAPAQQASTSGGVQQISWLAPEDPLIDKFAKDGIVPSFTKTHPNVKVQVVTPGSTAYGQKLLALVASGQVPEVYTDWGGSSLFTILDQKLAASLTPFFQSAKVDPGYVRKVYLDEYTVDGQLYALPWNSNPVFIVYNKTLFDKYQVPLPPSDWKDKSWTTDKLLETAKALTHNTSNAATSTWGLIFGAGTFGSLAWLWNADAFNAKGGPEDSGPYHGEPIKAVYPTRREIVDAMQWNADLTLVHKVSPSPTDAQAMSSYGNPIFSGRIGMQQVAGGWLERQAAVVKPKFEWGIAPFPYGPAGRHTMQREDNAWYVGAKSKHPEAGFQLTLYCTQSDGSQKLIEDAKDNPPVTDKSFLNKWAKGVVSIPGFAMTLDSFTAVFEGGVEQGYPDPLNLLNHSLEFNNAFNQTMASVWLGKSTAKDGLSAVKQKWESIIQTSAG